jgi:hypothetical protein
VRDTSYQFDMRKDAARDLANARVAEFTEEYARCVPTDPTRNMSILSYCAARGWPYCDEYCAACGWPHCDKNCAARGWPHCDEYCAARGWPHCDVSAGQVYSAYARGVCGHGGWPGRLLPAHSDQCVRMAVRLHPAQSESLARVLILQLLTVEALQKQHGAR